MKTKIKKLLLFFGAISTLQSQAQSYHIEYPTIMTSGDVKSVVSNNRIYVAHQDYNGSDIGFTLQKTDLNGTVLWRKHYALPSTFVELINIKEHGSSIIVGGNLPSPFFTSIDTTSGAVNYSSVYTNTAVSGHNAQIKDFTIGNNQVIAVGELGNGSTSYYLYFLRINALTGSIVNNGMSTFYSNQRAAGISYMNGSVYIVGDIGGYPFITKARLNGTNVNMVGSLTYSTGLTTGSSFKKLAISSSGSITIIGIANNPLAHNNMICGTDTNIVPSSSVALLPRVFTNFANYKDVSYYGSYAYVGGEFSYMPGVVRYNNPTYTSVPMVYSLTPSGYQNVHRYNNHVYFLNGRSNTGSNFHIIKGDTVGKTTCSFTLAPTPSVVTITSNNSNFGVFTTGTLTSHTPTVSNKTISPVSTCVTVGMNDVLSKKSSLIVKSETNAYIIESENGIIKNYTLIDLTGKELLNKNHLSNNKISLSLENYPKGLYFIKLRINDKEEVLKLINRN